MSIATFFEPPAPIQELDPLPHQLAGNEHRYDLARAFRKLATSDDPYKKLDGLEAETSAELARRFGRYPRSEEGGATSFFVPWDCRVSSRSFSTTTGSGGVPVILDSTLVDVLRAKTLVSRLGAR